MKSLIYPIIILCCLSQPIYAQNVGIGNSAPASKLDVNGDLALREGTAITVSAGANTITLPAAKNSVYRLVGASGAFTISSISGGNDGMLLTLINTTGQTMTVTNGSIQTNTGASLVSSGSAASVSLIYNASLGIWAVTASQGFLAQGTTNTLTNSNNTITSAVNGTTATAPAVNSVGNTSTGNSLTTTVNGVAASAVPMVNSVANTSSTNTLTTSVNGVAGTGVSIINSNTASWTQSAGITSTVNGISASVAPASGTIANILGYSSAGAPVYQAISSLKDSVSNTVSGNTLSTTVNGTTGTADTLPNLYTTNGALTANRTVTMGSDNLTLSSTTGNLIFSPSSTGYVGIGTASPLALMQVEGMLAMDGHKVSLRQNGNDSSDYIKWNSRFDKIEMGGWNGVHLGYTSGSGSSDSVFPVLSVNNNTVGIGLTNAIPKGGVGYAKFAMDGTDQNAAGPHVQYTTSADNYPVFSQLNWGHNNVDMMFDSYFNGNWNASSSSANPFEIYKVNNQLQFNYAAVPSGGAGNQLSWKSGMTLTNAGHLCVGNYSSNNYVLTSVPSTDVTYNTASTYPFGITNTSGADALTLGEDGSYAYIQSWNSKPLKINAAGNNVLIPNTGSFVGVGTSSPTSAISVVGSINIDANTTNTGSIASNSSTGNGLVFGTNGSGEGIASNRANSTSGQNQFGLDFYTYGTKRLSITNSGYIGINTCNPSYPLDVEYQGGSFSSNYSYAAFYNSGGGNPTTGNESNEPNNAVSIWAAGRIFASEFDAKSDIRIKQVVDISDPAADLQRLMGLRVTDFRYRDPLMYGNKIKKGFIAQQVEQVFPEAVSLSKDVVPSIMSVADCAEYDSATGSLTVTLAAAHGLAAGDMVKIIAGTQTVKLPVSSVLSDRSFTIAGWTGRTDSLFVYGREVSDFHVVDYDRIYTLNVSATQELAKKVKDLEQTNELLRLKIAKLEATLSAQAVSAHEVTALKEDVEAIKALLGKTASASVK